MNGTKILYSFLRFIPKPILHLLAYSHLGKIIIKQSKTINSLQKIPLDIGDGLKIYSDFSNPRIWNLVTNNDTEKQIKDIFVSKISLNSHVIDAGANIGEYSILACKNVGSSGKVICIEPFDEIAKILNTNLQLNNFENFLIEKCAIGSKSESRTIYENEISQMAYLDKLSSDTIKKQINVKTLDEIIQANSSCIELLKIDIEGYEMDALLGCIQSFENKLIKNIMCELHLEYLHSKGISSTNVIDFLKKYDFKITKLEENEKNIYILAELVK